MDGSAVNLAIFLFGTFAAAFVAAVAGFALGVVALAIWLYAVSPVQAAALIAAYALIVQGFAVWKLRRAINVRRLVPFVVGSALGIPAGITVLKWASPADLRNAVGVLLILFSIYSLARPQLPQVRRAGSLLDGVVGVCNGVIGASTGLGGTLPAIWCGTRGWNKDEQRAVFQPAAVATFLMMIAWLGGAGILDADVGWLFVLGLPALFAGTLLGWKLYGRLDEAAFRKVVVYVVLVSGSLSWQSSTAERGRVNALVTAVSPNDRAGGGRQDSAGVNASCARAGADGYEVP
jgi:uncharacterized membrane protein YfcA